ncbi:MAG: imidazole glycerol phosphate synthase subunit HisH [Methanobacteriaceae archaeon]|jgi:glutamine amidotransferase|nr:imidazole glycerol phosphate synthase subunit HisH [Methanobacteriaceae archaeon]OPY22905.1 MAG: imidazole glycerol phosphate synthase subunit HisH [Methanobacterium sp. PtaU1.Bin097]
MITIIDYGSGNLKSIKNGFTKIGVETRVTNDLNDLRKAEALVLPGVGAFGHTMNNLRKYGNTIHEHVDSGKPFLGICMGLQVLFSRSQESEGVEGLNIFEGGVKKFPDSLINEGFKIPHMGWNNLQIKRSCPILEDIKDDYMYFVHSYYVSPSDENIIAATVDYGVEVPAVICKDQVFATQFHPEKSGPTGLKILENFVELIE